MNKKHITEHLLNIQSSIESAKDLNEYNKLNDNYNSGIQICAEMIEMVNKANSPFSYDTLFSKFNRYVSDCLPWTGDILDSIDIERKKIETEIKQI